VTVAGGQVLGARADRDPQPGDQGRVHPCLRRSDECYNLLGLYMNNCVKRRMEFDEEGCCGTGFVVAKVRALPMASRVRG
jgi:hypothetical protein